LDITEDQYTEIEQTPNQLTGDVIDFLQDQQNQLIPISLGANINKVELGGYTYEGRKFQGKIPKEQFLETAFLYLHAPYLWGGKTPFGIDCSGLTQMVYKLNGYSLLRDASQQARQGEALSFIEESEPGDLAFFDNQEGEIIHVGIIMRDNYVIHAHGKVRIDRLDHSGIFNVDTKQYSHNLRVIKKII
ncbi:MAG: C40 family peptidase, partial [Mesonia sp.]